MLSIIGHGQYLDGWHFEGTHRIAESRSQELISTDEADCNVFVMWL
jgi:hypothetical protein